MSLQLFQPQHIQSFNDTFILIPIPGYWYQYLAYWVSQKKWHRISNKTLRISRVPNFCFSTLWWFPIFFWNQELWFSYKIKHQIVKCSVNTRWGWAGPNKLVLNLTLIFCRFGFNGYSLVWLIWRILFFRFYCKYLVW